MCVCCVFQPCPSPSVSFKQHQCSQFNSKSFGTRYYRWIPLYPGMISIQQSGFFLSVCPFIDSVINNSHKETEMQWYGLSSYPYSWLYWALRGNWDQHVIWSQAITTCNTLKLSLHRNPILHCFLLMLCTECFFADPLLLWQNYLSIYQVFLFCYVPCSWLHQHLQ